MYSRFFSVFITGLLAIAVTGCGEEFPVVPVSGAVTVDGEPLKNGYVVFQPIAKEGELNAGRPSQAQTDDNGRYSLATVDGITGAVVGVHRVQIKTQPVDSLAPDKLPAKFNVQSTLTYEVPSGGDDAANFDLNTSS